LARRELFFRAERAFSLSHVSAWPVAPFTPVDSESGFGQVHRWRAGGLGAVSLTIEQDRSRARDVKTAGDDAAHDSTMVVGKLSAVYQRSRRRRHGKGATFCALPTRSFREEQHRLWQIGKTLIDHTGKRC
jgi:hypothetical protein